MNHIKPTTEQNSTHNPFYTLPMGHRA